MSESGSYFARLRRWAVTDPTDFAAVAFCLLAVPLAALGIVPQEVLNAAILVVLALLTVELRRRKDEKDEIAQAVVTAQKPRSPQVEVVEGPDRVYADLVHLVRTGTPPAAGRFIRIASVRPTPRDGYAPDPRAARLMEAVYDRLDEGWTVRRLLNISSLERLDWELAHQPAGKPRLELRVLVGDPPPLLTPLVIGNRHAVIARPDPQGAGVSDAVLLKGAAAVRLATDSFDALWDHPGLIKLRSQQGIDPDAVTRLRKILSPGPSENGSPADVG
jgi:hypothetical protein